MNRVSFMAAGVFFVMGCAALKTDLKQAEESYANAQYEDTIAWLRDIEPSIGDLDDEQLVTYYYLRGMSAHRLGRNPDAVHYLALARELLDQGTGRLRPGWRRTLERSLAQLTERPTLQGVEGAQKAPPPVAIP